jgi:hypothetical protein
VGALLRLEALDGVAEHDARHRGGVLLEEQHEARGVPLPGLAQDSAGCLLHEVVWFAPQEGRDAIRVLDVVLVDEVERADDGGPALPGVRGARER